MRSIILAFLLTITMNVASGYAQLRNVNADQTNVTDKQSELRLTPERFLGHYEPVSIDLVQNNPLSFLETKTSYTVLSIAKNIIGNKNDIHFYSPSSFPKSITEYNNAIRRQMFIAEPTSQQRKSFHFLFN